MIRSWILKYNIFWQTPIQLSPINPLSLSLSLAMYFQFCKQVMPVDESVQYGQKWNETTFCCSHTYIPTPTFSTWAMTPEFYFTSPNLAANLRQRASGVSRVNGPSIIKRIRCHGISTRAHILNQAHLSARPTPHDISYRVSLSSNWQCSCVDGWREKNRKFLTQYSLLCRLIF